MLKIKDNVDIKEYIEKYATYTSYLGVEHKEIGHLETNNVKELLDIVNKAIGDDK